MNKYKVVETFVSINGEGTRAGQLAMFVRFKGCNLRCEYCDTMWANEKDAEYKYMSGEELLDSIKNSGVKNVTLTGGEPLLQNNIKALLSRLSMEKDLSVEIETNGSISLEEFCDIDNRPSFTMDYKLMASGMEKYMNTDNFRLLDMRDTVKFVVGSKADLQRAKEVIEEFELTGKCHIYLSPVFGSIELKDIVDFMIENKLNDVNMQLQMHKIIWDPDERGV